MNKLKNFVIASHLHCLTKQARYAHTYVLTHALVLVVSTWFCVTIRNMCCVHVRV